MTQEERNLLLKDLCARFPYGVKCDVNGNTELLYSISDMIGFIEKKGSSMVHCVTIDSVKPYLRSMDNMTEKERKRLRCLRREQELYGTYGLKVIEWLNANYIDYNALIPEGLALEAPEGMYNL